MSRELPRFVWNKKALRKYCHLRRKYPVSRAFLRRNWWNAKRFILHTVTPRCVLRSYGWRRRRNRVFILRRIRRVLFDTRLKKMIKRRLQNVRQWSKSVTSYYRKMGRIEEYEETELYNVSEPLAAEEVSKQMKEQLELLKSGKRGLSLIEDANRNVELQAEPVSSYKETSETEETEMQTEEADMGTPKVNEEKTPTKSPKEASALDEATPTPSTPSKGPYSTCSSTEKSDNGEKAGGSKFLDMLISKVRVRTFANESNMPTQSGPGRATPSEDDGSEDFVGFDESAHQPGMLLTPLVPHNRKTLEGNAAFVSPSLEAYMRKHHNDPLDNEKLLEPMGHDGQVTSHSMAPPMDMPAIPEALQRLRTVAERKQYLQRFKNHKGIIINNEANIYKELQRKKRQRKVKIGAMQALQSPATQMPFTRQGWQAASYVATENLKYYYQVMQVDGEMVRLPGAQGNNLLREKKPYSSVLSTKEAVKLTCNSTCLDARICSELKVVRTNVSPVNKHRVLNRFPLPAIFRPCPLSKKPLQRPLDDDTAALLLAGGSMAVVSMPTVQLDVMPQLGRPLHEIAKRYLQYILPHHDITREWAEFSVSTLQGAGCMKEAEEQAGQSPEGRRKSFTFVIPYMNDRNHVLVRRVVDRSEELDTSFHKDPHNLQQLSFRANVPDDADSVMMVCANVISDMINSVAISCSENSFFSEDPDAVVGGAEADVDFFKMDPGKGKPGGKKRLPTKQKRLALELRRLNATIIDAAARDGEAKSNCSKDFCRLGCVCDSLSGVEIPVRDHCGRAECVLECECVGGEQGRVVRVEAADGQGISNADAFILRRKATARLAKMEKEFTSTLVLTDNETLLINESQGDKKRRCTKAPKRYEDFDDTDIFFEEKTKVVSPTSKRQKKLAAAAAAAAAAAEVARKSAPVLREPCLVKDTDMVKVNHCRVGLRRLPDVDNLATFCMTHQLYKCFCGGTSPVGKPVVIEKEQWNPAVQHFNPDLATRAHYSFERPPDEPAPKKSKLKMKMDPKTGNPIIVREEPAREKPVKEPPKKEQPKKELPKKEERTSSRESSPPKTEPKKGVNDALPKHLETESPPRRSIELDTIYSYYSSRPDVCRRAIIVPKNSYHRLNTKRAQRMREYFARQETPEMYVMLKRRIAGAIGYYRKAVERQTSQSETTTTPTPTPAVIEVRDDSDGSESASLLRKKRPAPAPAKEPIAGKRKKHEKQKEAAAAAQSGSKPDIQVPRIAACYSLNASSIDVFGSGIPSAAAAASSPETNTPSFRNFYNEVVKNMNTLVSKKMQDIDLALQRDSKIIPSPNEEILCIIKWDNFLAAYETGYVFIWEVQMKTYQFLAATTTNRMPSVCGAIGVVNTSFAPDRSTLPLMARLLMEGKRNDNTNRLAVVMQGRQSYWLVKGFLRHMAANACTRPTPQTHPLLTKKINVLCSLLVKQRIRETQRKQQRAGASSPSPSLDSEAQPSPSSNPAPAASSSSPAPAQVTTKRARAQSPSSSDGSPSKQQRMLLSSLPKLNGSNLTQIRSNIEFRKVNHTDVEELQIPEHHSQDHRWVVLDLFDDFSHIFVPAFGDMISRDRIHNVMHVASEKQKVVMLQFFQNAPYDAFVTPSSRKKIYFGPLRLDSPPPVLVLLQSVDRKMMLREVYQREHSIEVDPSRRSMAFWVLNVNGQVHFEIDVESTAKLEAAQAASGVTEVNLLQIPSQLSVEIEREEDVVPPVVVLDSDEEEEEEKKATPNQVDNDGSAEPPTLQKMDPGCTNFTIEAVGSGRGLQITSTNSASDILMPGAEDLTPCQLSKGFMPFIANVPAKNGEPVPATQSLNPQVPLSKFLEDVEISTANPSSSQPPAKMPRLMPQSRINESLQKLLSNGKTANSGTPGGITITKVGGQDTQLDSEGVKIGKKRGAMITVKPLPVKALALPSAPNATKPPGTFIPVAATQSRSVVKILPKTPVNRVLAPGNESAPAKNEKPTPAASTPRLPVRVETAPRLSLPVKPKNASEQPMAKRPSLPTKTVLAGTPKALAGRVVKAAAPQSPDGGALPKPVTALAPKGNSLLKSPLALPTSRPTPQFNGTPPKNLPDGKIIYGIVAARGLPQFRVKLQGTDFMIKMPEVGVLRFKSFEAGTHFLNR
ncbi:hypothetical protein KR018_011159 [Drosophila ironensis]|nr:hypothetical protein KR018_011159 [Drosophila ironensis]